MPIIVEDVSFCYAINTQSESMVLDRVSLQIEDGEFLVIMGEIGSGKSTLIKHFNGLLQPFSGKVRVDGHNAASVQSRKLIGMLFQFPQQQLFGRTVFEDIAFGPSNFGTSGQELSLQVSRSLKLVGLDENMASRSPFSLSNGHMRLVAIAGILAASPKYIVLDEPFTGLDPKSRNEMLKVLEQAHATGVTVVIVTHNLDHVLPIATNLIFMEKGKVIFEGTPEAYFSSSPSKLPDIPQLMKELRKCGIGVGEGIFSVEAAFEEIMRIKRIETAYE
ncbi:ABC-type cobalt transport system, ATPase component [Methanomethylovorans hollandica DSM 15978]|uniref:ABC-type cobalt transport system, ATPase component n=1 Tax=Methanomethylovorans hollandica (strain DSM 15978 / NBRC 107637 / DMS1) TaxID=867904 RepID=L0KYE2_METHD|nr:ATP-binding cassette domain-containing protein [Methanomethylovorans hollandica]AGB50467.1 ABC-type cobalt transport system, ATPase component [Methanomethylovorans hollandica DSM 15978]